MFRYISHIHSFVSCPTCIMYDNTIHPAALTICSRALLRLILTSVTTDSRLSQSSVFFLSSSSQQFAEINNLPFSSCFLRPAPPQFVVSVFSIHTSAAFFLSSNFSIRRSPGAKIPAQALSTWLIRAPRRALGCQRQRPHLTPPSSLLLYAAFEREHVRCN